MTLTDNEEIYLHFENQELGYIKDIMACMKEIYCKAVVGKPDCIKMFGGKRIGTTIYTDMITFRLYDVKGLELIFIQDIHYNVI